MDKIKAYLDDLQKAECSTDYESFDPMIEFKGIVGDAYYAGVLDGKTQLARELMELIDRQEPIMNESAKITAETLRILNKQMEELNNIFDERRREFVEYLADENTWEGTLVISLGEYKNNIGEKLYKSDDGS